MDKALIAMSGGVDSSVAAWLMQREGYDCTGAMMHLYNAEDEPDSGCCSQSGVEDARKIAERLGIPFYLYDFSGCFLETVIERFIKAYENGSTPNPCIDCNRFLKFSRFFEEADKLGCSYMATGHYAQISRDSGTGRYLLNKSADEDKDQSYVLYSLTQEQLGRVRFPLGAMRKTEVRELAGELGFTNAKKRDSQDICFAPDGDYAGFIKRRGRGAFTKGFFKDMSGRVLGEHRGISCYTVGQRRGLGIAHTEPLYVREIRPSDNSVILAPDRELYSKTLRVCDINIIAADSFPEPILARVKIRYRHKEQPARVTQTSPDELLIEFDEPQRAITSGQSAVIYCGNTVVAGGRIV